MAKRNKERTRADAAATNASHATAAERMEQRVVAFAEQLGRMVGTIQMRAEGWMDRDALNTQLVSVRDGAAHLLQQLAGSVAASKVKPTAAAAARKRNKGRSGGVVDAPGKRHRKQAPPDPGATNARSQAGKVRAAMPMAKTNRPRGRA
jgi:hypothetical protein